MKISRFKFLGVSAFVLSLSVGVTIALAGENSPLSFKASDTYTCNLPSGYREIAVVNALGNNVTSSYKFRGTVTRKDSTYAYVQRVNQSNSELDAIALSNVSTSLSVGNIIDVTGGKMVKTNSIPTLNCSSAAVEVVYGVNATGYGERTYESIYDYLNNAYLGSYPYSRFVEVHNVKVEYEVGSDTTFVLSDIDNSGIRMAGYTTVSAVKTALDDYYFRGSNLSIKGVIWNNGTEDVLKILSTDDVSIYKPVLRDPQNTTILHAFNWSIPNIISNLDNIKNAGFKTIQLSPLQPQKSYYSGGNWADHWWKLYQPLGFEIASDWQNVLGTKTQLQELTAQAKTRGISIIVDVVANHLAGSSYNTFTNSGYDGYVSNFEADIVNNSRIHGYNQSVNDDSIQNIVQGSMSSCPDLNTGDSKVQERVIHLLKEYIDCGVRGFRFDAAKHIETPDDGYYASNFWTNVLGEMDSYAQSNYHFIPFRYGEVLSPGNTRGMGSYTNYMSVTAYGTGLKAKDCARWKYVDDELASSSYSYDVASYKAVTLNQTHDNFVDEYKGNDVTDEFDTNLAFSILGSRHDSACVFLARPTSSTIMGSVGSTQYKDSAVVKATNRFHNELIGAGEYIKQDSGNKYWMNIRKGGERNGAMIVNLGDNSSGSINLNTGSSDSMIPDGQYVELVSGNTVTVSGGYVQAQFTNRVMCLLGIFKGGTSISSGYGIKLNNRNILAVNEDSQDMQGRQQYKILRQQFKIGDTFSLYDFSTKASWVIDVDGWSFGGNSASDTKWNQYFSKGASIYTVIKDFTADIYLKFKYQDDLIYFDLQGLSVSKDSVDLGVGDSDTVTVSNYAGSFSATIASSSVASLSRSSDVLTITGVTLGSTSVTVTDGIITRTISVNVVPDTYTIPLSLGDWANDGAKIFAWVWGDGFDSKWVAASSNSLVVPYYTNGLILVRRNNGATSGGWDCWNRTGDIDMQKNKTLTFSSWKGGAPDNNYSVFTWN